MHLSAHTHTEGPGPCLLATHGFQRPTKRSISRRTRSRRRDARHFSDIVSGATVDRPGLTAALTECRPGDTLVVWKLDRLGRSLPHLVEMVRDLGVRGVGFKSVQESLDTTTSGGKLIFHIFASLAEFERDLIRERTNAGLSAARARGRTGGRPKGVDQKKKKAALALKKDSGRSIREICEIVGISRNTYYKYTRSDDKLLP